jgi:hypothetical protein
MRLLRGVYPEKLEGLAMTSYRGVIYAKIFWDATLAQSGIKPDPTIPSLFGLKLQESIIFRPLLDLKGGIKGMSQCLDSRVHELPLHHTGHTGN